MINSSFSLPNFMVVFVRQSETVGLDVEVYLSVITRSYKISVIYTVSIYFTHVSTTG